MSAPEVPTIDLRERSRTRDGKEQALDRRVFMQLLAFGGCQDTRPLIDRLEERRVPGVLYEDVNDPDGVALLTMNEDPSYFVGPLRRLLKGDVFAVLEKKPEMTMLGRTYAVGYEPDLEDTLIHRPVSRALSPEHPWAVWYPLRRAGTFEQLSDLEQHDIMVEHGGIGMAFGRAGFVTDIRLACHGLDKNDNDFVIGLVGAELYPLSAIVQRMRKTKQTSLHLERLGPFFIGRAVWQGEAPAA